MLFQHSEAARLENVARMLMRGNMCKQFAYRDIKTLNLARLHTHTRRVRATAATYKSNINITAVISTNTSVINQLLTILLVSLN